MPVKLPAHVCTQSFSPASLSSSLLYLLRVPKRDEWPATIIHGSGGSLSLVRTNQKISRNLPRFADLVNHLDRERPPTRKNLRRTRTRAQKFCQFDLGMSEFVDGVAE